MNLNKTAISDSGVFFFSFFRDIAMNQLTSLGDGIFRNLTGLQQL
jgi:hypothetical protein